MHDMMITPPRPPFLAVPPGDGDGGGGVRRHSIRQVPNLPLPAV